MKVRVLPYKRASKGAKEFAKATGILRLTKRQEQKHGNSITHIINWGSSQDRRVGATYINEPTSVHNSSCKKAAFLAFKEAGVPCPEFTTDQAVATSWLADGHTVVVRKLLRACAGRGIELFGPDNQDGQALPRAPLYVKYCKKQREYRVHVVRGEVIDVQEKKRRHDCPDERVDWQIRNHANGFIFAREDVDAPETVQRAAVDAVRSLELDFGAVDIGWHKEHGVQVYEVNTAPGIEGTTALRYFEAFSNIMPQLRRGRWAQRRTV
jgi:glutathione synthase/RimK-type ligase-like ATP-grasp enzyme